MSTALQPCPLCHAQAAHIKMASGTPGTFAFDKWHAIRCKSCGITLGQSNRRFRSCEDAANAWNKRRPQTTPSAAS